MTFRNIQLANAMNNHPYPPPVLYIEMAVPTLPCNFRCHYCYVGQHLPDQKRGRIKDFQHSPEEIAEALSIERLGGPAIINFCAGGETLIIPKNLDYIEAILNAGHYVLIVSNMTQSKAIDRLLTLPSDHLQRLFFKCSFHWLELKRLKLLDTYAKNVNRVWEAGASITVEITPSDELEPCIPEIMDFSQKHFGALPHITVPRDENHGFRLLTRHSQDEFIKIWSVFSSELFAFKSKIWGKPITTPCYSGSWNYSINLATGSVHRCSSLGGKVGNIFPMDKPFPKAPPTICSHPHCYNGHSWLCFGSVPGLDTPTHTSLRDRTTSDGRHWVHSTMRRAFLLRTSDTHKPYTEAQLRRLQLRRRLCKAMICLVPLPSWRRKLRRKYL